MKDGSEKKGIHFNVCGLSVKYFVPFALVTLLSTYLGFMPTVAIYTNKAGTYTATTFVATVAFLMVVGGIFFWVGNTVPILGNYLGGACLLPLIGASFMNFIGLIPKPLVNGCQVLMKGGFQDAYIALILVGSIFVMDRKVLLSAAARCLPTILGAQLFALVFCTLGGLVTGFGALKGLFYVGAPTMSGGSAGAMTTIPALYTSLAHKDMTGLAGQFLCYVSIANILAVFFAAIGGPITKKIPGWNGNGEILKSKNAKGVAEAEKRPGTSDNYAKLGGGIFLCLALYLAGNILGSLPVLKTIPGLAWTIILAIAINCTGIVPTQFTDYCVYAMSFALKALLPMLIAGIGVTSLKFSDLTSFFSVPVLIVIILGVLGCFFGAMLVGALFGLYPYEAGVTVGLCCCNIGGSGDIAVLTACDRMNLMAFSSIATRIGGALMVIWIGLLYPLLMH